MSRKPHGSARQPAAHDDPSPYMTRLDCLAVHRRLDRRFTRLELLNAISITMLALLLYLRFATGGP